MSLLAKEETIALPAFLLLYDFLRRRNRIRWGYYAGMLGLGALVTMRLFYVLQTNHEVRLGFATKGVSVISYALTQSRVICMYLRLIILPVGLTLDHDVQLSRGLYDPWSTVACLLLLLTVIGALIWLAWRGHQPALWALGFFVLLLPSLSIIPVIDLMFEHRVYFPLACLAIAAASLIPIMHPGLRAPVLTIVMLALLAGTIVRNRTWYDEKSLWSDVIGNLLERREVIFNLAKPTFHKIPSAHDNSMRMG